MNTKLKETIKKHLVEHLSISDDYAKKEYNCKDLREIIYSLVQVDGMNIVTNNLSDPNNKNKTIRVWVYNPNKHVKTCKDCMNSPICVDYKKGNSIPCLFFQHIQKEN